MPNEKLVELLAEWIDKQVIAEAIVDFLENSDRPLTLEEGKEVWLRFLELGGINIEIN